MADEQDDVHCQSINDVNIIVSEPMEEHETMENGLGEQSSDESTLADFASRRHSMRRASRTLTTTLGSFRRQASLVLDTLHHPTDVISKLSSSLHNIRDVDADEESVTQFELAARYRPESLSKIVKETHFSRKEVQAVYRSFKETAPTGVVTKDTFRQVFSSLFPYGDPSAYADCVFDTFDLDKNGAINFEEFVRSLSVLSRGTLDEKLSWVYRLYDRQGTGSISWHRLHFMICSVDHMIGANAHPPVTDDDRTRHTDEIFAKLDINGNGLITREEFFAACKRDKTIRQSICALNTVLAV